MNNKRLIKPLCTLTVLLAIVNSGIAQSETKLPVINIANSPKVTKVISTDSDPYFVITKDTVSSYGPRSITRNMQQDKNGNMWFATWQGIMKYDGKEFTNYTLKENLIRFHVFSVLKDRSGNLWFGTIRGGLYKYDGVTFTLFTTKDGLVSNFIECIQEDDKGNIWIGTDEGVSCYDGRSFKNYSTKDGLSNNFVHAISQDRNGKLWFATHGGVNIYDGKSFTAFTKTDKLPFNNVRSIIEDKNGIIWIGSQDGLNSYDGITLANLTRNFIGYIFEDSTGNLWLSEGEVNLKDNTWHQDTGMALTKYDGKSFTKIKNDRQLFGITEDSNGNIWFGTDNGVWRYDGKNFNNFSKMRNE